MKIVNPHFDLKDTFECGQAFRYERLDSNQYQVIAYGKRLTLDQDGDGINLDCSQDDFNQIWENYFDLTRDYGADKKQLILGEPRMEKAIKDKPGIRILQQDPFEMIITFILSQNKSMPQIKVLVNRLAQMYGDKAVDQYGDYDIFPTVEQLSQVTEATFRSLKVGFRAPYLVDGIHQIITKQVDLDLLRSADILTAKAMLKQIKGIGDKVADCVLLFGFHRFEVFPLDVWMKRIMNHLYAQDEPLSDQQMMEVANKRFGSLAGLAQQYLFYHYIHHL